MTREELERLKIIALEKSVGYNKNKKISMQQLKECILNEDLDMYSDIVFNPKSVNHPFVVGLIENGNSYIVFVTGERGSYGSVEFSDKGLALNYMLARLRSRKQMFINDVSQSKKIK